MLRGDDIERFGDGTVRSLSYEFRVYNAECRRTFEAAYRDVVSLPVRSAMTRYMFLGLQWVFESQLYRHIRNDGGDTGRWL
jgi:hypothetical protein